MPGRHRKPTSSPVTGRAVLRAGVAAAAVTAPLAISGTALAAPDAPAMKDSTWDKMAQCESTGDWQANTGNGFRGGLQFTDETWKEFGGTRYAAHPDQASREQQIAVAKKVEDEQGWTAWPVCSKKTGVA